MLGFDTETTGLLRPEATEIHLQPYITEIYIAKFDNSFNVTDSFHRLVKPPVPISAEITRITGIDDETLKDAPSFIGIYDDLCEFVKGESTIFAHNCSFDISMLANELRRYDMLLKFPWPKNHMCTVELSMPIRNKRFALGALYEFCTGKQIEGAHRAKNDVDAMIECIKWLKENGFL